MNAADGNRRVDLGFMVFERLEQRAGNFSRKRGNLVQGERLGCKENEWRAAAEPSVGGIIL
jgi:hypothetical protein